MSDLPLPSSHSFPLDPRQSCLFQFVNAIQAFNQDGEGPPVLENIALDWASHPLSASCWNHEAIAILSLNFHTKLKSEAFKEVVYQEESMNLPALRCLCGQKLVHTHQAHHKQALIITATPNEQEQVKSSLRALEERCLKGKRKVSRHFGVCSPLVETHFFQSLPCLDTCEAQKNCDKKTTSRIQRHGMPS